MENLLKEFYKLGMIKTWYRDKPEGWKLVSGLWSPVYINLRDLPSFPSLFKETSIQLGKIVKESKVKRVVGIASAGIPIASAISVEFGIPMLYTRKLPGVRKIEDLEKAISTYGVHRLVEGVMEEGDELGLVDDLITRADSKLVARSQVLYEAKIRGVNVSCDKVFVVFDRGQGGKEVLEENGVKLYSLIKFKTELKTMEGVMSETEIRVIEDYLENPSKYQNKREQEKLKSLAIKKIS